MYIGIDIGGTNLKVGVLDEELNLDYQNSQPTRAWKGRDAILASVSHMLSDAINRYPFSASVGVGVPGVISRDGVVMIAPNLPGWKDLPLNQYLSDKFNIPITVENDANTGAIAELEMGAAKDLTHFLYVTLGTGVGGAIVLDRKIFHGQFGGAGEIGHMIIDVNDRLKPEKPFRTGILEEFVGKNQITAMAYEVLKKFPNSILNKYEKPDPYYISEAAAINDSAALRILKRVGEYLGLGLASAMNLLDIRAVVVGGGISQAHPAMLESTLTTLRQRAMPTIAAEVDVRKAFFTKDAGVIGAAMVGKKYSESMGNM